MYTRVVILSCFLFFTCHTGKLHIIADLPADLKEVSGIETDNNNQELYMINDSGNSPKLFVLDQSGKFLKTLKVDANNEDWEELTTDKNGHIFIGDFGNNMNDRKDLVIYKVKTDKTTKKGALKTDKITFKFPDQEAFPPKRKKRVFDCEAFFHWNNNLYLFTKSRAPKNYGQTTLYRIPDKKGDHIAQKLDTFTTCEFLSCWITAADISEDGTKVALLTPNSVWIFSEFEEDQFFSGKARRIDLEHESQKEGLCFIDNNTLFITDEQHKGRGRNLYSLNLLD